MENKQKIIVVLGQTATGKSDFAVEISMALAMSEPALKNLKGVESEIISADSRQVYKGMDLGTGKITRKEMRGVKHHLLDITSPSKIFTVSDFQKKAFEKIEEIINKGKIPIICGGTGFYIDAVVNNMKFPEVPPNKKLRAKLEKETTEKLFEILKKLDPKRSQNIDSKNKVRLIRAIEIASTLGKVPSTGDTHSGQALLSSHPTNSARAEFVGRDSLEVLKIGLVLPPEILKERIQFRLLARIKKGMIREIKNLHEKKKVSWKKLESFGLEYRYVSYYLQGKLSKKEMIEKLNTEIWHFAKRQKTWFKRDQDIVWIDPRKKFAKQKTLQKIKEFLK